MLRHKMVAHTATVPEGSAAILEAWQANAAPWTTAVREQRIVSRRCTDRAIVDFVVDAVVDAVVAGGARRVLDIACGDTPYRDGWRQGGWAGIGGDFAAPAPWYFRTLSSWVARLNRAPWRLQRLAEPCDPDSGQPLSPLLIAVRSDYGATATRDIA